MEQGREPSSPSAPWFWCDGGLFETGSPRTPAARRTLQGPRLGALGAVGPLGDRGSQGTARGGRALAPPDLSHLLFFFSPFIYPPTLVHDAGRAKPLLGGCADPDK